MGRRHQQWGTLSIINSTISGNSSYSGGGIYRDGGRLSLLGTILAGNSASSTTEGPDVNGPVNSQGNNLIGRTDASSGWVASDLTGTSATPLDAMLGALQDNGGPTHTMMPLTGSPAIDAGSNAVLSAPYNLTTDQRVFFARSSGPGVDIGAVEFGTTDSRLPVELSGFTLSATDRNVRLVWRTASETDNAGFEVERAVGEDEGFMKIASYHNTPQLAGLRTSSYGKEYRYVDGDLLPGFYRYRLVDVSTDGMRTIHPARSIRIESELVEGLKVLRLQPIHLVA